MPKFLMQSPLQINFKQNIEQLISNYEVFRSMILGIKRINKTYKNFKIIQYYCIKMDIHQHDEPNY